MAQKSAPLLTKRHTRKNTPFRLLRHNYYYISLEKIYRNTKSSMLLPKHTFKRKHSIQLCRNFILALLSVFRKRFKSCIFSEK